MYLEDRLARCLKSTVRGIRTGRMYRSVLVESDNALREYDMRDSVPDEDDIRNGVNVGQLRDSIEQSEVVYSADMVRSAWAKSQGRRLGAFMSDRQYWAIPRTLWDQVIRYSDVDSQNYQKERYDCDDFAVSLKGQVGADFAINGVGIVMDLSGQHAYNAILVHEGKNRLVVEFVEPQSDAGIRRGQRKSRSESYKMESGFVFF